ncbi:hypothetical protein ABMA28_008612 [Loxostege sticticalis]
MSYSDIGALPQQVMEEDSPGFHLDLVDEYIKKDYMISSSGALIDASEAVLNPSNGIIDPSDSLTYYEEETMPVSSVASHIPQEHAFPYPRPPGPPIQTVDRGRFNFTAKVTNNSNKKYLYSEGLNKVYADVNCDFAVQFNWEPIAERMFVRACVVFADKEHAEKRVECCMQHRHAPNVPDNIRLNILRSSRELGTQGVYYHGDPSSPDSWYSVVVEFNASTRQRTHAYKFACKNSCSTGINRRSIQILFTLEDIDGTVYGRQVIAARICSCPPRDCRKDEETAGIQRSKKRVAKPDAAKSKKVKIETLTSQGDEEIVTFPPVQVVGHNVVTAGLDIMVKMMEHGKSLKKDDPEYVHACNISIENLKATLEQYRRDNGL